MSRYEVVFASRVEKKIRKLPEKVREKLNSLIEQLADEGPIAHNWPNYGKIGRNKYHCHLDYSHVACWFHMKKTIIIEVYYAGSREDALY